MLAVAGYPVILRGEVCLCLVDSVVVEQHRVTLRAGRCDAAEEVQDSFNWKRQKGAPL